MANQLLRVRDALAVRKLWAYNFVRRRPELYIYYSHKYDYQRAKYEDQKAIREWFNLIQNIKAKHRILDDNTYNFNKTGFMMGIIHVGMVAISSDGRRRAKLA